MQSFSGLDHKQVSHIKKTQFYFLAFCVSCILDKLMSMTLFKASLQ